MTGEQIRDMVEAAIKPAMDGITRLEARTEKIDESINGNGHPGLKGRLTRVETVLAIVGSVAIIGTSMASCAISNKVISVPTQAATSK